MEKVVLTHVLLRVLRIFRVSYTPPLLHAHHHIHVTVTRGNNRSSLGNFHKVMISRKSGDIGQIKIYACFVFHGLKLTTVPSVLTNTISQEFGSIGKQCGIRYIPGPEEDVATTWLILTNCPQYRNSSKIVKEKGSPSG